MVKAVAVAILVAVAAVVIVEIARGDIHLGSAGRPPSAEDLPPADLAPAEYVYLDSSRVSAYLGQAVGGLGPSETRTQQLTDNVNASLSAGTTAQLGASEQAQSMTQTTVTATAADHFYTFLRLLRKTGELHPSTSGANDDCSARDSTRWLGDVDASAAAGTIAARLACIGQGNFVRVTNAHLYLPPYAHALPRAQNASVFYDRFAKLNISLNAPTLPAVVQHDVTSYQKIVGRNPRLPFVATTIGVVTRAQPAPVTFFVPARYKGLTREPSLLSAPVTVMGKIVYMSLAPNHSRTGYTDVPTVTTFGRAMLAARHFSSLFLSALGLCGSTKSRGHAKAKTPRGGGPQCDSPGATIAHLRHSVTFKSPVVVILPLAIYD
jgi:hypothetical protein